MKVICVACELGAPEIEESEYNSHMAIQHGGGQLAALAAKRNVPKIANLPPGVSPKDLPTDEFLKTVKEIEEEKKKPIVAQSIKPQDSPGMVPTTSLPMAEKKPKYIHLKYVFEGDCPQCNTPIRTIMVELNARLFAIAFCLTHEQIKQIEVRYIYDTPASPLTPFGEEEQKKALEKLGLPKKVKRQRDGKGKFITHATN